MPETKPLKGKVSKDEQGKGSKKHTTPAKDSGSTDHA